MATTEERMKILQMIQEGKISPEEGAKLLSTLTSSTASGSQSRTRRVGTTVKTGAPRWLRVRVTNMATGGTKVNVNLPLKLVDAGLNIAGHFIDDLDFDDVASAIGEALDENMVGKIVDIIEGEDGEHIEIFIE